MPFEEIKLLLQDNIGIHTGGIGDASIERAIKHRMVVLDTEDENIYLSTLISDNEEMNELVEEVVVPETWFFRNSVPFETMAKCVRELNGAAHHDEGKIRILSIPCSTGEEPYSIAIMLLKNGIAEDRFLIDAVDISKKALKKARRAIYGKHSFRESGGECDPGYFTPTRSGQQVLPKVKKHVNFVEGNILKDSIAPGPEYYDIIFCRNLLIYFDRSTQKKALEKLDSLLKRDGVLFLGHAETTDASKDLFIRQNIPNSFAYKKKAMTGTLKVDIAENEEPIARLEKIYSQLVNVTLKDLELSRKYKNFAGAKSVESTNDGQPVGKGNPVNVDNLIEQGYLSDASAVCMKWLDKEPEDAQGYYYLGLISSLEGNVKTADSLLKKAIYLNPNHHKALGLSASLAEQRGDWEIAESLRARESRAKKRSK